MMQYVGMQAFQTEPFSIPANSECRVQFEYLQVVNVDENLAKYVYPLNLAKSMSDSIESLVISMEIESKHAINTLYSPSHEVAISRKDDYRVHIGYEGTNVETDDDFLCYYAVSDENFGINLITHREDENEDGYFMLLISPKYEVKETEIIEKDFIFVLDHSGSMKGQKVEQAKEALRYCVHNLNDGDRFNLILFNTDITVLSDKLDLEKE